MRDLKERRFEFSVHIVQLCQEPDETLGVSRTLASQLLRSGTSIGTDVEEAHGSQSNTDLTAILTGIGKNARKT